MRSGRESSEMNEPIETPAALTSWPPSVGPRTRTVLTHRTRRGTVRPTCLSPGASTAQERAAGYVSIEELVQAARRRGGRDGCGVCGTAPTTRKACGGYSVAEYRRAVLALESLVRLDHVQ